MGKLPPAKKSQEFPPFAAVKKETEKLIKAKQTVTLLELQRELNATHLVLYPEEETSKGNDLALNASQVKVKCHKCGGWGHKSYNCKSGNGGSNGNNGSHGRNQGRYNGGSNNQGQKETRVCFFCKKPGHLKADCFAFKKKKTESAASASTEVVLTCLEVGTPMVEDTWAVDDTFFDDFSFKGDDDVPQDEEESPEWMVESSGDELEWCLGLLPDEEDHALGLASLEATEEATMDSEDLVGSSVNNPIDLTPVEYMQEEEEANVATEEGLLYHHGAPMRPTEAPYGKSKLKSNIADNRLAPVATNSGRHVLQDPEECKPINDLQEEHRSTERGKRVGEIGQNVRRNTSRTGTSTALSPRLRGNVTDDCFASLDPTMTGKPTRQELRLSLIHI